MNSPYGRKATSDGWVELGSRYERFESQPPKDEAGDYPQLSFKQRRAFRIVQDSIDTVSNAHTSTGSGRRTRTSLPTLDQVRYEKWWRGQVASILNRNQAAEASAQVIYLTPDMGERRAA